MKTIKVSIKPYAKKRESIVTGMVVNGPFIENFGYGIMEDRKLKVTRTFEGEYKNPETIHHYTIEVPEDFRHDIAKKTIEWSRGRQFHKYEVIYKYREQ